jgi:hypothetical protein
MVPLHASNPDVDIVIAAIESGEDGAALYTGSLATD